MKNIYGSLILLFGIISGACSSAAVNTSAVDDSRFVQASGSAAPDDAARNVDSTTAVDSQTRAFNSKSQISHRQKPRRKNIRFPRDCVYTAGEFARENRCAAWLEKASLDFPADADCDYDQFRQPDNSVDLIQFSEIYGSAVEFYRLSAGKHLVQVRCSAGAYNVANFYLLYDETDAAPQTRILEFPTLEFPARDSNETPRMTAKKIIGGRSFNPKTKELIVFVKGRGIGDFGEYARYAFARDGTPRLKEFRAQIEENGVAYGTDRVLRRSPKKWRRYYPR